MVQLQIFIWLFSTESVDCQSFHGKKEEDEGNPGKAAAGQKTQIAQYKRQNFWIM
jgi:hypothetical protein